MELRNRTARLNGGLKERQILGLHDSPLHKAPDNGAYSQMNKQFDTDKYWKGNKESGVYFDVAQKREPAGTACRRREHREHQQR